MLGKWAPKWRVFLTLYAAIVLVLAVAGRGLDLLWQMAHPLPTLSPLEITVLNYITQRLDDPSTEKPSQRMPILAEQLGLDIQLQSLEDFAQSRVRTALMAEVPQRIENQQHTIVYYKVPAKPDVIVWRQTLNNSDTSYIYYGFIALFYGAIALGIALWLWPLSRDLRQLEQGTKLLGTESDAPPILLAPTSPVFDLASAFNRMAERIRHLLISHKEMTYAVSHELRTPLARMKFGLEMAAEMQNMDKIKQHLKGVRDDVTEMDQLVQQMLAYASFESRQQILDLQEGDMQALLRELFERLQKMPGENPVEFKLKWDDVHGTLQFDGTLQCEWYLMERALMNVLQNAQRFAKTSVQVELIQNSDNYVIIINDDGPGIPEQDHARVFQSFVRLNNHTNAQTRGLGLGLAIVQRIMRWHGGFARVQSSPLGGAQFILQWPKGSV